MAFWSKKKSTVTAPSNVTTASQLLKEIYLPSMDNLLAANRTALYGNNTYGNNTGSTTTGAYTVLTPYRPSTVPGDTLDGFAQAIQSDIQKQTHHEGVEVRITRVPSQDLVSVSVRCHCCQREWAKMLSPLLFYATTGPHDVLLNTLTDLLDSMNQYLTCDPVTNTGSTQTGLDLDRIRQLAEELG